MLKIRWIQDANKLCLVCFVRVQALHRPAMQLQVRVRGYAADVRQEPCVQGPAHALAGAVRRHPHAQVPAPQGACVQVVALHETEWTGLCWPRCSARFTHARVQLQLVALGDSARDHTVACWPKAPVPRFQYRHLAGLLLAGASVGLRAARCAGNSIRCNQFVGARLHTKQHRVLALRRLPSWTRRRWAAGRCSTASWRGGATSTTPASWRLWRPWASTRTSLTSLR